MLTQVSSHHDLAGISQRRMRHRRILLVNPPMETIGAEFMQEDVPLRLEYLASYVRDIVDVVDVFNVATDRLDFKAAVRKVKPDLVGISINYLATQKTGLAIAKVAHDLGIPTVIGGYHATAMAADFAQHPFVNYVVRGEGEVTFRELVMGNSIESIRGLSFKLNGKVEHNTAQPLIQDLDSIPLPDRSRRGRKYKLPWADLDSNVSTSYDMLITSRGCWGRCTFCTENLMTAATQRYRKPAKVIEELDDILQFHEGKRLRIYIADPNFGGKRRITEELYERMIDWRRNCGADVHFFVNLRASAAASSRELTRKMVAAGIDYVFIGMESPNKQDLKTVDKGGETKERQATAARYLREEGAEVMANFLIGLPSQTPDDIMGVVEYAKSMEIADCSFAVMTPLPGTKLFEDALQKGLLLHTDVTRYRMYDPVMKHPHMSREKIREMTVRANARWYDDLMLPAERRRALVNGRKRKLYDFAGKFQTLSTFFVFLCSGVNKEFAELDPKIMVIDMPNPKLREFTEKYPINEFIEMRKFLRILGKQCIRVTMEARGQPVVSWIAKTTPNKFEYIDVVHGVPDEKVSIQFNMPLDPGMMTGAKAVRRILDDNPSLAARVGLLRLAAAAGSEVAAVYIDRAIEAVRSTVNDVSRGRMRPKHLLRRMLGLKQEAPRPRTQAPKPAPAPNTAPASDVIAVSSLLRKAKEEHVERFEDEPIAAEG